MRIVHINIRLAEGGAGQVAFSLHQGLLAAGHESQFLYGYASGIRESAFEAQTVNAEMIGDRVTVIGNFAAHRLIGADIFTGRRGRKVLRTAIAWADVIHLHAVHHHFVSTKWLFRHLAETGKPIVWTLHDYWPLTGRCAVPDTCGYWRDRCGRCPSVQEDLPSYVDFSARLRAQKGEIFDALSQLIFSAPSPHIASAARNRFPARRVELIPNFLPRDFAPAAIARAPTLTHPLRARLLVMAADLSYRPKTDVEGIIKLQALTGCRIVTMGKNSPFADAENHGFVADDSSRREIMASCDAMLFTSTIDSFGMVVIEALASGLPVLAAMSPATQFIMEAVGGQPYRSIEQAAQLLRSGSFSDLYAGQTPDAVAVRCLATFSFDRGFQAFTELYSDVAGTPGGCRNSGETTMRDC